HLSLAEIYWNTGRMEQAVEASEQAVALATAHGLAQEDLVEARLGVAQAKAFLDEVEAETITRALLEEALAAGHADSYVHRDIMATLGVVMVQAERDRADVIPVLAEELRLSRAIEGEDSGWYAYRLAASSATFLVDGQRDRARDMLEEAVRIVDAVYRQPHQLASFVHCGMGAHLHLANEPSRAMEHYEKGVAIDQAVGRKNIAAS